MARHGNDQVTPAVRGGMAASLRDRVWNLLRTARGVGRAGVAVVTLSTVLGASPEGVLAAMLPDMTEGDEPAVYCQPTDEGPCLVPRRFL
jgi:hypothetical protein